MRSLVLAFLIVLACGCEKKQPPPERRILNLAFGSEISSLDPRMSVEGPTMHVIRMLFDGLMRRDQHGNFAPAVAERYSISKDLKTYTFNLRDSYWSDGYPVTAWDFEYAWKKSLSPQTLGRSVQSIYFIKNAEGSAKGTIPIDEVGVKALDAHTLQVELEYPAPYFLEMLGSVLFYPIPKHLDEKDPSWAHRIDETFVSNGPFTLKKWKQGKSLVLKKNLTYWDQQSVSLPGIKLYFIEDGLSTYSLYKKKAIDWIGHPLNQFSPEMMKQIQSDSSFTCLSSPMIQWFFLNTAQFPFNHKKIRQAFSYCINRKEIVRHVFQGNASPAYGVIAPCLKLGNFPCFEDGNFKKAKKLFQEALEELQLTPEGFPTIKMRYRSDVETLKRAAQMAQEIWEKTFHIRILAHEADWATHMSAIDKGDYDIGMLEWLSCIEDPIYTLQAFKYKNGIMNRSLWESQNYIDLLNTSNVETDLKKRRQVLIAAEKLLMDEMPVIPLGYMNMEFAQNPKLIGVILPKSQEIDFKFAKFFQ